MVFMFKKMKDLANKGAKIGKWSTHHNIPSYCSLQKTGYPKIDDFFRFTTNDR